MKTSIKGLNVFGVAIGIGAAWAFMIFFAGIASIFNWGLGFVTAMSSVYIGYGPSILGTLIGTFWGFIDGAIFGIIFAAIYNTVIKKYS